MSDNNPNPIIAKVMDTNGQWSDVRDVLDVRSKTLTAVRWIAQPTAEQYGHVMAALRPGYRACVEFAEGVTAPKISDTPRTDAVMTDPLRDGNDLPHLCRELERENAELRALLTPRKWNREQHNAWHANLPDTESAFAALLSTVTPPNNQP